MHAQKLILVVDRREESLILFHQILRRHGYDVVLAASPEEALEQSRRHRPDLILMDPGVAGDAAAALAGRLREDAHAGAVPIAALSAEATGLERSLREAGFCAVVPRRTTLRRLLESVRRCLEGSVGRVAWQGVPDPARAPA